MGIAASLLIIVGALQALLGMFTFRQLGGPEGADQAVASTAMQSSGMIMIVEGLAVAVLGAVLLGPVAALRTLVGAAPRSMGAVMSFFSKFLTASKAYVIAVLVLAVAAIGRLVF
jgi:hypothetical protein